jgi:uncharacterized protein (TIGR00255 family)
MIKSMTGFGRADGLLDNLKITVEIRSVNHKFQELSFKMPKDFFILEEQLRKKVKEYISRGRVDLFLSFDKEERNTQNLQIDWQLISQYIDAVSELHERYNLLEQLSAKDLIRFPNVVNFGYDEIVADQIAEQLLELVDSALQELSQMRLTEGASLYYDLVEKLRGVQDLLGKVEERAPLVVKDYQERLTERIQDLTAGLAEIDESRVLTEVAFFADKVSIDEEVNRLKSHFSQFLIIIDETEPVGRKLDFLIQEINREVNTIGSKANDISLSQYVVEMKSEIEKIREQVQNIE